MSFNLALRLLDYFGDDDGIISDRRGRTISWAREGEMRKCENIMHEL
jgi:hypothetical protein